MIDVSTRYIVGDTRKVLATLPDASVDLVLSSPPFLALRSYLPDGHPDKALEIGSEATPGEFLDVLLDVVEECRRVLAPHGTLAFELGDTYAGGGNGPDAYRGGVGDVSDSDRGTATRWTGKRAGWPLDKSLCLIPELFRVALVYGVNPLTGRTTPRWRARNVIRWVRPNPPVGALGDKFRPATSDLVVACTARDRYFDLDAVREPLAREGMTTRDSRYRGAVSNGEELHPERVPVGNPAGAPPLDWWCIPPKGYDGSHYAVFPAELCVRPIKAMCPERVCTTCGQPSRRITEANRITEADDATRRKTTGPLPRSQDRPPEVGWEYERTTLGWTDCGHDDWRPGLVLDPFAGSGTTMMVAHGHGRSSVGIDLDERNADLAQGRLGMFLQVDTHTPLPSQPSAPGA